jgi:alkylhydroperoxidase/carboxymuconolactone decarboxylase family protein YurZ
VSAAEIAEGERQARRLFGDERYERSRVLSPDGYRRRLLALADEVVFGTVYARSGLSLEQRALCTIAALAALGQPNQLRVHVAAAVRLGIEPAVIAEVITQIAMYAGFPAALNAAQVLDDVTAGPDGTAG